MSTYGRKIIDSSPSNSARPSPSRLYPLMAAFLFVVIGLSYPLAFIGAVMCLAAFISEVNALDARYGFYFGKNSSVRERQ